MSQPKRYRDTATHRFKDIQLPQVRSFCLAALERSFSAAARAMGLSVATVWQHVRALEQRLGVTLLRAEGRSLTITEEGKLLLELIHPHLSGLDSLSRLFEARRQELPQQLTVASTHYLFCYQLPRTLKEYSRECPSVRLNLRAGLWPEVIRLLEQGRADVGVISYGQDGPRSPHLDYEHLFDLEFTVLTSAKHPLARKKEIVAADLAEFPLILSAKETYGYKAAERVLNRAQLMDKIHVVLESPNTDVMRKYAALGLGVALAYTAPGRDPAAPGLVQRVLDPDIEKLPVVLAVRKWAYLPEHVEQFRKTVRHVLGKA